MERDSEARRAIGWVVWSNKRDGEAQVGKGGSGGSGEGEEGKQGRFKVVEQ